MRWRPSLMPLKQRIWRICESYDVQGRLQQSHMKAWIFRVANIIRGTFKPISSIYSRTLSSTIATLLNTSSTRRPSLNDVMKMPAIRARMVALQLVRVDRAHWSGRDRNEDSRDDGRDKRERDARKVQSFNIVSHSLIDSHLPYGSYIPTNILRPWPLLQKSCHDSPNLYTPHHDHLSAQAYRVMHRNRPSTPTSSDIPTLLPNHHLEPPALRHAFMLHHPFHLHHQQIDTFLYQKAFLVQVKHLKRLPTPLVGRNLRKADGRWRG